MHRVGAAPADVAGARRRASPTARRTCGWPASSPTSPSPTSRPTRTPPASSPASTTSSPASPPARSTASPSTPPTRPARWPIPAARRSFVRAGIALYGISPGPDVDDARRRPAAGAVAAGRVSFVKRLPAGSRLSYGLRHTLAADANVATVPLGYADGVRRGLSSNGDVLIGGRRRPIIGTVTMDQLMVDCGDDHVRIGDEVVLIGAPGRRADPRRGVGRTRSGTIGYEIVCGIGARVPAPAGRRFADARNIVASCRRPPASRCARRRWRPPTPSPRALAALSRSGRHDPPGRRDGRRQDGVRPGLRPGPRRHRADHVADVHARAQLRHRRRDAAPRRPLPARPARRGRRPRPRRAGRVPRHRRSSSGATSSSRRSASTSSCASTSSTATPTPALITITAVGPTWARRWAALERRHGRAGRAMTSRAAPC